MSALPNTLPASSPSRPKGRYTRLDTKTVQARVRKEGRRWTFLELYPDLFRISRGNAQSAFLTGVYFRTEGLPHSTKDKTWAAPEFTEVMLPEDWGKESGFTRQQMLDEIEDAIGRALATRKCGCPKDEHCKTFDHYRYALSREAWKDLPNRFIPRKPPTSVENTDASDQSQSIAIVRVRAGRRVRFEQGRTYDVEAVPLTQIRYHLESPVEAKVDSSGVMDIRAVEEKPGKPAAPKKPADVVPMPTPKPASPPSPPQTPSAPPDPPPAAAGAPMRKFVARLMPDSNSATINDIAVRAEQVDKTDFARSNDYLRENWPAADVRMIRVLVAVSQAVAAHSNELERIDDEFFSSVLRAVTKKNADGKRTQTSAALFMTTLPQAIDAALRSNGKPGTGVAPREESYWERRARETNERRRKEDPDGRA